MARACVVPSWHILPAKERVAPREHLHLCHPPNTSLGDLIAPKTAIKPCDLRATPPGLPEALDILEGAGSSAVTQIVSQMCYCFTREKIPSVKMYRDNHQTFCYGPITK